MKQFIKNKYPELFSKSKNVLITISNIKSNKSIFTGKYLRKDWGSSETVSGPGSEDNAVKNIISEMPLLVKSFNIRFVLDAACGDFHWMRRCTPFFESYVGVDVVAELIADNNKKYAESQTKFLELDISKDTLPDADMIICRDCLVHLSYKNIINVLQNFIKSKSAYLLTTSFEDVKYNEDIITGGWRTINLQKPPFNFPQPVSKIYEKLDDAGKYFPDKILGMWKLSELSIK